MFRLAIGHETIMIRPKRIVVILLASVFIALNSSSLWADADITQIFLVQNSGWMLPFYEDRNSKLKQVVVELTNRVGQFGNADQIIASFNQSIDSNKSPLLAYRGKDKSALKAAVESIQVAHKPGKSSYADTDFKEAIVGAITQFTPGKPCILWIITNNMNSPDNSQETVAKNKEFYNFLQTATEIKRIVAFPHAMPVRSHSKPDYTANGLMIYAMAYGGAADGLLQQMLAANMPFGKQSARLKPLDMEALTFVPGSVATENVDARLASDHKTLVMTFAADRNPESAELSGRLRNDFYPYDISSADVSVNTAGFGAVHDAKIAIETSIKDLSNIPAGGFSPDINVKIKIPPIPSPWNPEILFGNGYTSRGVILFELDNQRLNISSDFVQSMSTIFPHDPLPDLFVPGDAAKKSVTQQGFIIRVNYPGWPLLIVATLALLLLGGLIGGIIFLRQEKIFRVSVDGVQKTIGLRPFASTIIKDQSGVRVGTIRRDWTHASVHLDKDKTNSVRIM